MKLLDEELTRFDKDNYLRLLDGCICRICVSDDPFEIVRMLGFANDYLSMLAQNNMLRIKREQHEKEVKS